MGEIMSYAYMPMEGRLCTNTQKIYIHTLYFDLSF